jgi:hypothetical protein
MASVENTYDAFFITTMMTMILGFCGLALRFCLKSKCDNCGCCWGCIKVHRRVELEEDIEIEETPQVKQEEPTYSMNYENKD